MKHYNVSKLTTKLVSHTYLIQSKCCLLTWTMDMGPVMSFPFMMNVSGPVSE